ncbi:MAG: prepilin-type N-terminal cleavage/methylation domain-containing protein [Planctomycetota bacterium]|nr:prepilin-type N-terminal cleavage/methylation domain-containing protein [Planctomycetota bacterium]
MVRSVERTTSGVTLIELLVVLSILSALLAMSVTVYRSFGDAQTLEITASRVSTTVRAARNWSISSGMPSRVLIDPEQQKVTAFGFQLVAAWDFEDFEGLSDELLLDRDTVTVGAYRQRAQVVGQVKSCPGSIGKGALFLNDGAAFRASNLPSYEGSNGVSVEAWVNFWKPPWQDEDGIEPDGGFSDPRREMRLAVLGIPHAFELGLLGDGAVYMEIGDSERAIEGEFIRVQTEGAIVIPDRWVHLRATFDGIQIVLEVDGVEHEWVPEGFELIAQWPPLPSAVPHSDSELWISHPDRFFLGAIDQIVLRVATSPEIVELPVGIELLGPSTLVHLDSRGALDPLHHNLPVVIHIAEVGDFSEAEIADGTAVAGEGFRQRMERERSERETRDEAIEQAFGDPISDLMNHLESWNSDPSELEDGEEPPVQIPLAPGIHFGLGDVDGISVLRLHNVVVDLTGAIRG